MATPINRAGIRSILPAFIREANELDDLGGDEVPDFRSNFQMPPPGPEVKKPFEQRHIRERQRARKIFDKLFDRNNQKMFANMNYGEDGMDVFQPFMHDVMQTTPTAAGDKPEVHIPLHEHFLKVDPNQLYGLKVESMEDLDYMVCGKLDVDLVKFVIMGLKRNGSIRTLEPNFLMQTDVEAGPRTNDESEAEYQARKSMMSHPDYQKALAQEIFENIGPVDGYPWPEGTPDNTVPIPVEGDYLVPWPRLYASMVNFSMNPNDAMKEYIYEIATKVAMKPEATNFQAMKSRKYISMRDDIAKEPQESQAQIAARGLFLAGRVKKRPDGKAPQQEVLFIDMDSLEEKQLEGGVPIPNSQPFSNKAASIVSPNLTKLLSDIEKYSQKTSRKLSRTEGLADLGESRKVVLVSKYKLKKEGDGGVEDMDEVVHVESQPVTFEEARDIKIPYFFRSLISGPRVPGGHDLFKFVMKVPDQKGGTKLVDPWLRDANGNTVDETGVPIQYDPVTKKLNGTPAFSKEMLGMVNELTNLASGLSFKGLQFFLMDAISHSAEKDKDGSIKQVPHFFDAHEKPYSAEDVDSRDINGKPAYFNKNGQRLGARRTSVVDFSKMGESISGLYKDRLLQEVAGQRAGAIKEQFEVWNKAQIGKNYSVTNEKLKEAVQDYSYGYKAKNMLDTLESERIASGSLGNDPGWQEMKVQEMKDKLVSPGGLTAEGMPPEALGFSQEEWDDIKSLDVFKKKLAAKLRSSMQNTFLLHGPPGTGKTSFAAYIANVLGFGLIYWNLDAAKNKWVGGTGERIRDGIEVICRLKNYVVILDEVDKVLSQGAVTGTTNDSSNSEVAAEFMRAWEAKIKYAIVENNVIVVATTNYLENIGEAIRRRLLGETGRHAEPLEVKAPQEEDTIRSFVDNVIQKFSDANDPAYLKPDQNQFSEAWTVALAREAKDKKAPYAPFEINKLYQAWYNSAAKRKKNIEEHLKSSGHSMSPQQINSIIYGPKALVKMTEMATRQSQNGGKGIINIPADRANSAEFLLGAEPSSKVEMSPSWGIQPTAPGRQPGQPVAPAQPHRQTPGPVSTQGVPPPQPMDDSPIIMPPSRRPGSGFLGEAPRGILADDVDLEQERQKARPSVFPPASRRFPQAFNLKRKRHG